ncbi:16963_t:CDS:2 [Dentiscutata heterogama]|uniref:16963_t:CDS:1 n=1 Tax=Dentiscutata heterogama TaxID=1316150 RepID=A0ACA9M3G1_9GLOM|nr:16963_t:CDS:2 [Dentiscutata heterogama]
MPQIEEVTIENLNTQTKSVFESGPKGQPPNVLNSLKRDHDLFKSLHQEFNTAKTTNERERIAKEIMKGIGIHDKIEQLVFYPALKDCGMEIGNNYVKQSLLDHDNVKSSLYELNSLLEDEGDFVAHAEVEENEIFIFCQKIFDGKKIEELGKKLDEMRKMGVTMMKARDEVEEAMEAETEAMEVAVE